MRKRYAIPLAVAAALLSVVILFVVNIYANTPNICGRGAQQQFAALDSVLFLPTIWFTGPIGNFLNSHRYYREVLFLTFGEELFLGGLYGFVAYLLLRRLFRTTMTRLLTRWRLATAVLIPLIGISVAARVGLAREDFGAPIEHADPTVSLKVLTPAAGKAIALANPRTIPVPGDSSIIIRSGFDPLVLLPGEMSRDAAMETHGPLGVLRDGALLKLSGDWGIGLTGEDARCSLAADPIVVMRGSALGGAGTEDVSAMSLRDLLAGKAKSAARALPVGSKSATVLSTSRGLVMTGFGYVTASKGVAALPPGEAERASSLVVYDVSSQKPELIGIAESFSDHDVTNADSALSADGVVHIIATEVLMAHDNSSRVHHLRFDPVKRKWLGDDVLMVRPEFTSASTPRVLARGNDVDAFWLQEGGQHTLPSDGLYAHRIGETAAWRLIDHRVEFAVLPDFDGAGSMLVGAAVKPSENGVVRWFIRRGTSWTSAGETDLGVLAYTLTLGTEPFGLWRDAKGVHAAFRCEAGVRVVDLVF